MLDLAMCGSASNTHIGHFMDLILVILTTNTTTLPRVCANSATTAALFSHRNLENKPTDSVPSSTAPSDPAHQQHSPIPADTAPPTSQPPHSEHHSPHAAIDPSEGFEEGAFHEGLDEFSDFGINEDELMEADLMEEGLCGDPAESAVGDEGEGHGTEQMEEDWLDDSGHDHWPDDAERELFDKEFEDYETSAPTADNSAKTKQQLPREVVTTSTASETGVPSVRASVKTEQPAFSAVSVPASSSSMIAGCSANYASRSKLNLKQERFVGTAATTVGVAREQSDPCEGPPASSSVLSISHSSSRSKLSLKQQSSRTRVVQVTSSSRPHPPVASVRPFQCVESVKTESILPACSEQPYPLQSLSQLSTEFWQSHPVIKIRVSHSSVWIYTGLETSDINS